MEGQLLGLAALAGILMYKFFFEKKPLQKGGSSGCNSKIQKVGNHIHALKNWDLKPGTYTTSYDFAHTHRVTLTLEDVDMLKMGKSITKETTKDSGHKHNITIKC